MKTVVCQKPVRLSDSHFETDVRHYRFRFSAVETALVGSLEENDETQLYSVTVGISWELRVNWGLSQVSEENLVKILFEFGKRHIILKLQEGVLSQNEVLMLTTLNSPNECPFKSVHIVEPEGATFEVDTNGMKAEAPPVASPASSELSAHLEQRRQRSRLALIQLYQLANGGRSQPVGLEMVAQTEGWNHQETSEIYTLLLHDNLIEHFSIGGYIIQLTHQGVVAAESLLENEVVKKRRANRVRVLEKIYQQTRQHGPTQMDLAPIAQSAGIEGQELSNLYEFLTGEGFVRPHGAGYYIIMLPEDQLRVENVLGPNTQIEIFFCYSHADENLRDELQKHLGLMQRQGSIAAWHDRKIGAGQEWQGQISEHLNRARVILLLVSVDFINSDYCWNIEVRRAMAKHTAGTARVIPIILRPCDWHDAPFGGLQALPTDACPVIDPRWHTSDAAFLDVAKGIRKAVEELRSNLA